MHPQPDPDGLLEFSVVYTDWALNHMSRRFQTVMTDISTALKDVYKASAAVIVPGGGTYGMEAVARQFADGRKCLVIQNGMFSFRWSQILEKGQLPSSLTVLKAEQTGPGAQAPFAPVPAQSAAAAIAAEKPDIVFMPHVETSAGVILPDDYIRTIADAVHAHGGLAVLDCIASGAMWADMEALGVDILLSAPQKTWSAPPSAGLVMLSDRALAAMEKTEARSFACDLKKWRDIMAAYEGGGFAYHATMPTDALAVLRDRIHETRDMGYDTAKARQTELGERVRALLAEAGMPSVAAPGFEAPPVIVSYTTDPAISSGAKFVAEGAQIAAGVPLMCGEGADFRTFRVGLFGLTKLNDVDGTVADFEQVLAKVTAA